MIPIIIAGGDEAGRGAVLGPIVVSIVSISKGKEAKLARIGVRDSKMLTRKRRSFLYDEIYSIADEVKVYKIESSEINEAMKNKVSINELEALNFAKLIDSLEKQPGCIFLDSPDVISERFGLRVSLFSKKPMLVKGIKAERREREARPIKMVSEHKADSRYPVVSGASIIAKVTRDAEIEKMEGDLGIEIGSGYPSDKYTIEAIRKSLGDGTLNGRLREYWKTLKYIRQRRIDEFL